MMRRIAGTLIYGSFRDNNGHKLGAGTDRLRRL
jgi:hypothetical protein